MKIKLIAVGTKMPKWVAEGYNEYIKRLDFAFDLCEISLNTRHNDLKKLMQKESQQMLAQITPQTHVIACDLSGKPWSTEQLAKQLDHWKTEKPDIALLIGGPEGLSQDCLSRANQTWCLSNLTLPHPLVRIVVAEQIYRASMILKNHPYHK
jgi:23S rRNA (pseudouridine1915-N3)-methyltransferase